MRCQMRIAARSLILAVGIVAANTMSVINVAGPATTGTGY